MKTAIYIEDGVIQLVLTPESDFERNTIKGFADKKLETKIFDGSFYDCRGGWTRQKQWYQKGFGYNHEEDDQSLILRVEDTPTQ